MNQNRNPPIPNNIKTTDINSEGDTFSFFDATSLPTNSIIISPTMAVCMTDSGHKEDTLAIDGLSIFMALIEAPWAEIVEMRNSYIGTSLKKAKKSDNLEDIGDNYFAAWQILHSKPEQALVVIGNGFMNTGFSTPAIKEILKNEKIKVIFSVSSKDGIFMPDTLDDEGKRFLFSQLKLKMKDEKAQQFFNAMRANTPEVYNILKNKSDLEKQLDTATDGIRYKI